MTHLPHPTRSQRTGRVYHGRQGGRRRRWCWQRQHAATEAGRGHDGEEGSGGGHGGIRHQCRAGADGEPWMQGRGRGGHGEHRRRGGRWRRWSSRHNGEEGEGGGQRCLAEEIEAEIDDERRSGGRRMVDLTKEKEQGRGADAMEARAMASSERRATTVLDRDEEEDEEGEAGGG